MSEAPERIWASMEKEPHVSGMAIHWSGYCSTYKFDGRLEFIRADLAAAREAEVRAELEAVRAMLRIECRDADCNDWDDDLHLADVIEKYLVRQLRWNVKQARREALEEAYAACNLAPLASDKLTPEGRFINQRDTMLSVIRALIEKGGE